MKIPKNPDERAEFYQETVERCMASRPTRKLWYEKMKSYLLFGSDTGGRARFNKIWTHADLMSSFLFASETTRFAIKLGAAAPASDLPKAPVLAGALNDDWHDSHTDVTFADCLLWSLAWGCTHLKLRWDHGMRGYMVEPSQIGVYAEHVPELDDQEAVCHRYHITPSELNAQLKDDKRRESIMEWTRAGSYNVDSDTPAGVQQLVLSASSPQMIGSLSGLAPRNDYRPRVNLELVEMYELYCWDDEEEDYRVATMADPGVFVYDRLCGRDEKTGDAFFVKGELPLVKVCPIPLSSYYWGMSTVDLLTELQDWREQRLHQIRTLLDQQVDPPTSMFGYTGNLAEKAYGLKKWGAIMQVPQNPSMAKIERHTPQMPEDLFRELKEIDEMFDEASGLTNVMQGRGEHGVRAKGHADLLARLSSARTKKRALITEDALEKVAALMVKLRQQHGDEIYVTPDVQGNPEKWSAKMFTADFSVKVDAHSSSPIFVEDLKKDAAELHEMGVIDGDDVLDMYQPPNLQLLKAKYAAMKAKQAAQPQPVPGEKPPLQAVK